MDLSARQQEALQIIRAGKVAKIDRGETAVVAGKRYPTAMLNLMVNLGLLYRQGEKEERTWHRR